MSRAGFIIIIKPPTKMSTINLPTFLSRARAGEQVAVTDTSNDS